jgi:peptidoglycan-associated lipoprotein
MIKARGFGTWMVLGTLVVASGCATRGQVNQLERELAEQRAELAAERTERIASTDQLSGDFQRMAGNLELLRTDLATMDSEFGAKLAELEEGLQLAVPVHFAFDEADVRQDAAAVLDRFAQIVQRHYPDAMITVEGFTDPAGPAEYNRRLAQRRAEAVREELVRRGLLETQLRAVGYGAERQVVPGAAGQAFGAELNRRVVFVIETATPTVLGTPTASR